MKEHGWYIRVYARKTGVRKDNSFKAREGKCFRLRNNLKVTETKSVIPGNGDTIDNQSYWFDTSQNSEKEPLVYKREKNV